ncbi:hypothetical protein GS944_01435 [Rhodococcus hoagii]|nr:hypothetical protein [Prescottella equi]
MGGAQPRRHHERRCRDLRRTATSRIDRRIAHKYLDTSRQHRARAAAATEARDARKPLSIGLVGNAAEISRHCWPWTPPSTSSPTRRRTRPAVVPAARRRLRRHEGARAKDRSTSPRSPASRWPRTSRRWSASWTRAPRSSTTATPSATRPARPATTAPSSSRLRTGVHPPAVRGGPRPVPLGRAVRRPKDIAATDKAILELFPENEHLKRWRDGRREGCLRGPAARICWLGYGSDQRPA